MLDLTGKGGPCNNNNDKNKGLWSFPELMRGFLFFQSRTAQIAALCRTEAAMNVAQIYQYGTFFTSLLGILLSALVMIMSL